jgi:hypothetical protein
LSDGEKQAIWERVLKSHGSGKGKFPKALRELYEKARQKKTKKPQAEKRDA